MAQQSGFVEHAVLNREAVHGEQAVLLSHAHEHGEGQQPRASLLPLERLLEDAPRLSVRDGYAVAGQAQRTGEVALVEQAIRDLMKWTDRDLNGAINLNE